MSTFIVGKNVFKDYEKGPFQSIQEAINSAKPGDTIKIFSGLYSDNIFINKPNLKLEINEVEGDPIILTCLMRACILIDLPETEKCTINGLQVTHTGENEELEKFQDSEQKTAAISLFQDVFTKIQGQHTNQPDNELLNRISLEAKMNCLIFIKSGILEISKSFFTLNYIKKSHDQSIPAIVINENASLIMNDCKIKGNTSHQTIGIIARKPKQLTLNKCSGILLWSSQNSRIVIKNCKIMNNEEAGIHCCGHEGFTQITKNNIEKNKGAGIKIGIANKSIIKNNEIAKNELGIECISCEPIISSNNIDKNEKDGIYTHCFKQLRCDSKIYYNDICGNAENGIHCEGKENYTKIKSNVFIGYNKKAGIRADNNAKLVIQSNFIQRNFTQGILLVESSIAYILMNKISENVKANIAFGGENSNNTVIRGNKIEKSLCEGIYQVEGGEVLIFYVNFNSYQSWILSNEIIENNDGIVISTAIPEIKRNLIVGNKNCGILMMHDSRPKIQNNSIFENDGIGLYIRDKSHGIIKNNNVIIFTKRLILWNKIKNNEIELAIEKLKKNLSTIEIDNEIIGEIRTSQLYKGCNLF